MSLLGESTLALDEEMLQVLDAADPVKPVATTTVSMHPHDRPASPAASDPGVQIRDRAPLQPTDRGLNRSPNPQEGDCMRPGWRSDCKDLAQKLLFSEYSEDVEHAHRGAENNDSKVACGRILSCEEMQNSQQAGSSRRKSSLCAKHEGGSSEKAGSPLNVSSDYILFSPTRLAAAIKRAKLQRSLQNQSASVLTVPSGLELSTLSDTLPQPG